MRGALDMTVSMSPSRLGLFALMEAPFLPFSPFATVVTPYFGFYTTYIWRHDTEVRAQSKYLGGYCSLLSHMP